MPPRTAWRPDFPPVIVQAEYMEMREHFAYRAAKNGESNEAALSLVSDLLSDNAVENIKFFIRESRPRIVPVHAEEARGRNKIPAAYAEALAEILGLDTDPGIIQSSVANHGGAPSIYHRLVSQPSFAGYVEPQVEYMIVDDNCTAGGTLANLKGFIETNGGIVILMSVLAHRRADRAYYISLANETLARLKYRHRDLDALWREEFGYGIEALTEGEAGHLLAAPSVDTVRNRLIEARRDLNFLGDEGTDREPEDPSIEINDGASGTSEEDRS